MTSSNMIPALATHVEASAVNNFSTLQRTHTHFWNPSRDDYVQQAGAHLSSEDLGLIILRVEVGSGKEPGGTITFKIHYKLLCTKVPMFKHFFGDSFEQGTDQENKLEPDVVLPNDDPKAFKLLVGWLYTDKIDVDFDKFPNAASTFSFKESLRGLLQSMKLPMYIKLCILAELYEITRLENEAINFLIKFMIDTKARPNPPCWLEVYKNTDSKSALRVLFSRIAVWQLSHDGLDDVGTMDLESILCRNEELREDILTLKENNEGGIPEDPFLAPPCDYHNHGPVDECPYPRI